MDRVKENKSLERNKDTQIPWYKIPMVWLVIALPLTAVIASTVTIVIAVNNAPQVIQHGESYKSADKKPK